MRLPDRLAVAALRGIVSELSAAVADPARAREVLRGLLGGPVVPTPGVEEGQAPAVEHGEPPEPEEVQAERARGPRRAARRPAAPAEAPGGDAEEDDEDDESARGCARSLVAAAGGVERAARTYGFKPENLRRWLAGGSCAPSTLRRLHAALLSPVPVEEQGQADGSEDEARAEDGEQAERGQGDEGQGHEAEGDGEEDHRPESEGGAEVAGPEVFRTRV